MKDLISIIVPVYGVEDYLCRCVDSIIAQTYKELDIILVDDGSPDGCGSICDSYAKKDSRIRVIHKKNGGLSDARNVGIGIANGIYISFVDSDDWVSPYYIENLYIAIKRESADLAISQFENVYEGDSPSSNSSNAIENYMLLSKRQCLEKMFYQDGIEICAWGKLYKTNFFKNIRYPVGKLYEDIPVTYQIITRAEKIAVVGNVDYYYLQRMQSIQYQEFNLKKLDAIEHTKEMVRLTYQQFPELVDAVICRYFSCVCNILFQIPSNDNNYYREMLWKTIKKYRWKVLKNHKARVKARIAAVISYLGLGVLDNVYKHTQQRGMRRH